MKNIFKFFLSSIAALALFLSSAQADNIRIKKKIIPEKLIRELVEFFTNS